MLGKLDIHIQNNETGFLFYTVHKTKQKQSQRYKEQISSYQRWREGEDSKVGKGTSHMVIDWN